MEEEQTPMVTKTPQARRTSKTSDGPHPEKQLLGIMILAAQSKCDCRPCNVLRTMVKSLTNGLIEGTIE